MSDWDGQSRGNVLGYKIFIFILRHVHIRVAYFVVWFVALYFYLFVQKAPIRYFYSQRLQIPRLKTEIYIFRNFLQFGKSLIDKIVILAEFKGKFTFEFEGEEYLHQIAGAGQGGIILGAHAGNWEIAGHLLRRVNKPVNVVMYENERSNIKEVLEDISGQRSFHIISVKENDLSHVIQINEVLERGELIAMHGDRFREGARTQAVTFLGEPAKFPLGPYFIAAQRNVPVCFVHTMKEGRNHYHFYATPPQHIEAANRQERQIKIDKMVKAYANSLQEIVKKYPEQWYNYFNFWNS